MAEVKSFRQLIGVQPSSASTADSTLVIIDAQNEYAQGALKTVGVANTRKAIATLLEKYRSTSPHAGANIVHVVHQTPKGAPVFTPDTELAEEFDELTPKHGEHLIEKNYPSSFAKTDLHEYLQGVPKDAGKKIVLVGYMAHVCVSTTARAGAELGYDVVIAKDAVGDRDIPGVGGAELTKITLNELEDAFATVLNVADVQG